VAARYAVCAASSRSSCASAIDQYAEAALGNRQFFLNKPYGIGGGRNEQTP
jgi:hypothetical protein